MFLASFAGFSYLYRNAHIGRALLLEASSVSMTTDCCYDLMKMHGTKIASTVYKFQHPFTDNPCSQ